MDVEEALSLHTVLCLGLRETPMTHLELVPAMCLLPS